ncbi:MAG: TlpA family protein disulfide reductase [Myxococcales bacterium]|nr:TlpA family protein disulfide reductase [Myxococcales bacterium]
MALLVLGVAACGSSPAGGPSDASSGGAKPPDFELSTLDGQTVRLSDHLGKDVILIDFWATFCDPCLASMPHLDELYKKHKAEGFVVLGVSIDGPESAAQVKSTVSKLGVSFPILLDQETRVVALYNPKTSAPYSVLIGRDGSVLTKKEGYTTGDGTSVDKDVEAALARK